MKKLIFYRALLTCLMAVLFAAPSLAYPKWISFKSNWSLVRNEKQKNQNASDYKRLKIVVTYTNNSKDKIITMLFDKTINFTCDFYIKEKLWTYEPAKDVKIGSYKNSATKWTAVDKVSVYPGQSKTITYWHTCDLSKWKAENRKKLNTEKIFIKNIKWKHDFSVQTKKIPNVE